MNTTSAPSETDVVRVSSSTGSVVGNIAGPWPGGGIGYIEPSTDPSMIWVGAGCGACCGGFTAVSLYGGSVPAFGSAQLWQHEEAFLPSPDGVHALIDVTDCNPPYGNALYYANLFTGEKTVAQSGPDSPLPSWSFGPGGSWGGADNGLFVHTVYAQGAPQSVDAGPGGIDVQVIGPSGSLGMEWTIGPPSGGCWIADVQFLPHSDDVLALVGCPSSNGPQDHSLVEIDARTGQYGLTWLTVPNDESITGYSIDPSEQWVLYQVAPPSCSQICKGPYSTPYPLYVLHDGGSTPIPTTAALVGAVW